MSVDKSAQRGQLNRKKPAASFHHQRINRSFL